MDELRWTDIDEIACRLFEAEPELNPLRLGFGELADRILALAGFTGKREECNERILEAIQMAWLAEHGDE